MKTTRFVIGSVVLALTLVIAIAGSILVVDNFSENKVAEVSTTNESDSRANILKSDNKTDKLALKNSEKNTDEKINPDKKHKIVAKKKKNKKKTSKLKSIGTYKITGYCGCSSCCGKSDGITASGTRATAGRTIAADTTDLPFGTKVVIDGHTYTVEDVGGAINGNHIDVYFSSHSKALQWGVRYCKVYVVK